MAEIRTSGTWGSALSTEEFAAIRSAGFEPVGQVLGAAVYNIGFSGGYNCPGAWSGFGSYAQAYRSVTQVSGRGGYGSFGPLTQAMYDARHLAINRMVTECAELGGHGIVGVYLSIGSFPAGGLEFKVIRTPPASISTNSPFSIGTAVRAPGSAPLQQPFSSDLSGQDFAKLLSSGWVPAGLALGISVGARHDDWLTVGQTRWGAGNAEVVGYTELVNDTRHDARQQLEKDVRRLGGEGVVVQRMDMRVHERECPIQEHGKDHIVEATIVGTALVRFASVAKPPPPLAILSLDPQRRQAARVKLGP